MALIGLLGTGEAKPGQGELPWGEGENLHLRPELGSVSVGGLGHL